MRATEFIPKEIELRHEPTSTGGVEVHAYRDGQQVGWVRFQKLKNGQVKAAMVHVPERLRRQGIGSAMYSYARDELGLDIVPSDNQTDLGRAFWNKLHEGRKKRRRRNRSFGGYWYPGFGYYGGGYYGSGDGNGGGDGGGGESVSEALIGPDDPVDVYIRGQHKGETVTRLVARAFPNKNIPLLIRKLETKHGVNPDAVVYGPSQIQNEELQFLGEYPSIQTFMGEDKFGLVNYPSKEQQKIHRQYDISRNKEYANYRPGSDLAYIGDYTSGDSYSLNDYLHRHYRKQAQKDDEKIYKKQVQSLDRALTLQQLKEPLTVYTAVPESPANAWAVYGADVRRPIRLHLPAYTSTTTSLKVAIQFAEENLPTDSVDHRKHPPRNSKKAAEDGANQIIMLTIPAGTPAASIKNVSDIPEENEVLLPRGMNIEVNPRPTMLKNGDYVWHAQVIDHNPVQIVFSKNVSENFADGRVKGRSRPGRVKRSGASCAGSVSELRSRAKKYGGERGRMYHWCANMKGGKK
jgi:hypothetical protein